MGRGRARRHYYADFSEEGYDGPCQDAGLEFRRAAALGQTDISILAVKSSIKIGDRIPYYPTNHYKAHGRPGLVMATYAIRDGNDRFKKEHAALELATATTRIDTNSRYYTDGLIYRKPDEVIAARANLPGEYRFNAINLLGNRPKHFPINAPSWGNIDPFLWPEIIAARADALLYNTHREEIHRQEVPDCWLRTGLIFEMPKSELADKRTFAPDVPLFYSNEQRATLKPWTPGNLKQRDIGMIIDIVASEIRDRNVSSLEQYNEIMNRRRALLGAKLGHYYEALEREGKAETANRPSTPGQ